MTWGVINSSFVYSATFFFFLFGCEEAPFQDCLCLYYDLVTSIGTLGHCVVVVEPLPSVIVLRISRIDSYILDPSKPVCVYKLVSIVKGLSRAICDTSSAPGGDACRPVRCFGPPRRSISRVVACQLRRYGGLGCLLPEDNGVGGIKVIQGWKASHATCRISPQGAVGIYHGDGVDGQWWATSEGSGRVGIEGTAAKRRTR